MQNLKKDFLEIKRHKNKPEQQFACELLHRKSGYAVLRYRSEKPGLIADIEIPAGSTTIAHYWQDRFYVAWRMFEPVENAPVVDPGHFVDEPLVGLLEGGADVADAGIEYHGVEAAAAKLGCLLQGFSYAFLIGYVHRHEVGADFSCNGGAVCNVTDRNRGSTRDERLGNGAADARCTAGYEGAFSR